MKQYEIAGLGPIKIYKKRGNRNIRLSFDSAGNPRVSLPVSTPYHAGLAFARQKKAWIIKHRPAAAKIAQDGQLIAGKYSLVFKPALVKTASARVKEGKILVTFPKSLSSTDEAVQAAANRGITRALKLEAERYLLPRLAELAEIHGFTYGKIRIKAMRRRWGSCDSAKNISLNLFLVQLTPDQIDYVLLHELTHTEHPHHQASFWRAMEKNLAGAKKLAREVRAKQPVIS